MTQSTPTEAWLKEADEILAEYVKPNSLIDSGNLFHAASLYRQVISERERSAPDEQEWEKLRDEGAEASGKEAYEAQGGYPSEKEWARLVAITKFKRGFDAAVTLIARPLLEDNGKLQAAFDAIGKEAANSSKALDSARAEAASLRAENRSWKDLDANNERCINEQYKELQALRAQLADAEQKAQENLEACGDYAQRLAEATKALEWQLDRADATGDNIAYQEAADALAKLKAGRKVDISQAETRAP
jgi:hypothetical protein